MRKGQMLLEVVLALAIVTIVMVALVQLSTRSIKNSDFSRSQAEATSYASGAMEVIRVERNNLGWEAWYNSLPASNSEDLGNGYTRTTDYAKPVGSPERVTIKVMVTWDQGGVSHSAKQDAIFTRY